MENIYVKEREKTISNILKKKILTIYDNILIGNVKKYCEDDINNFVNYNMSKDNPILVNYFNNEALKGIKGFLEYKSFYSIDHGYDTDCCKRTMEILCFLLSKNENLQILGFYKRYVLFKDKYKKDKIFILETETMNTVATEFNKDIRNNISFLKNIEVLPESQRKWNLEYLFANKFGIKNGTIIKNGYTKNLVKEKNSRLLRLSDEEFEKIYNDKKNGKYLWLLTYYDEICDQKTENKYNNICNKCFTIGNMILVPYGCNAKQGFGSKSIYSDRFDYFYNELSDSEKYCNYIEWKKWFDNSNIREANCIDIYFDKNKVLELNSIEKRCMLIEERGKKIFKKICDKQFL